MCNSDLEYTFADMVMLKVRRLFIYVSLMQLSCDVY